MADTSSFDSMIKAVNDTIPGTWGPRREQPEWDRDFGGNADINEHFGHRTDKAHMWLAFCLNFSEVLIDGYDGITNVRQVGLSTVKTYAPKGKQQFDK
jgi:hypothetical protein